MRVREARGRGERRDGRRREKEEGNIGEEREREVRRAEEREREGKEEPHNFDNKLTPLITATPAC